jgi:hypothetical protein
MDRILRLPAAALLALAVGCGGGSDATAPDSGGTTGGVPATLVGNWRFEQILDQTCDPSTGQCLPTSATTETLNICDDSHFDHVLFAESNFPPCRMVVQHQSEGTAEVQDSTLLLHMSSGTTRVDNNCGETDQSDEAGQTDTYTWEVTQGDSGQAQLRLVNDHDVELGPFELVQ